MNSFFAKIFNFLSNLISYYFQTIFKKADPVIRTLGGFSPKWRKDLEKKIKTILAQDTLTQFSKSYKTIKWYWHWCKIDPKQPYSFSEPSHERIWMLAHMRLQPCKMEAYPLFNTLVHMIHTPRGSNISKYILILAFIFKYSLFHKTLPKSSL